MPTELDKALEAFTQAERERIKATAALRNLVAAAEKTTNTVNGLETLTVDTGFGKMVVYPANDIDKMMVDLIVSAVTAKGALK